MNKTKRILIPIDGSDNSKRAFLWAIDYVYKPNDEFVFVHIIDSPVLNIVSLTSGMNIPVEEWTKNVKAGIEKAENLQGEYGNECVKKKIKHEFFSISCKSPGEGICDMIQEKKIDLVIIGSRGLGKIKRTFLGSVSDYVIHRSSIPVTVVPPE